MLVAAILACTTICTRLGYDEVVPPENENCRCVDRVNAKTPDVIEWNARWKSGAPEPREEFDDRTKREYDESDE